MADYNMMQMPPATSRTSAKPADAPLFEHGAKPARGSGFDMTIDDFMVLIMAQFQNQDVMNPASTDDFLNQMVQMMTIQTMTNMNDIATISYAASLVGKEVTIGIMGKDGLEEIVGVVTGTGARNGQQVIIVNGKEYGLNQILAVGRLPDPSKEEEIDPDMSVDPDNPTGTERPDGDKEEPGQVTNPTDPAPDKVPEAPDKDPEIEN